GAPDPDVTCTPLTLPCSDCVTLGVGGRDISSDLMAAIDPVTSLFLWIPYPTTTISSSPSASSDMTTSIVARPLRATSCVAKPTNEKTRTATGLLIVQVKAPSRSGTAPLLVPFSSVLTPGIVSPEGSVTVPETVVCWA